MALGNSLVLRLFADVKQLVAGLQTAGTSLKRFTASTAGVNTALAKTSAGVSTTGAAASKYFPAFAAQAQAANAALIKLSGAAAKFSAAGGAIAGAVSKDAAAFSKFAMSTKVAQAAMAKFNVAAAKLSGVGSVASKGIKKLEVQLLKMSGRAKVAGGSLKKFSADMVKTAGKSKVLHWSIARGATVLKKYGVQTKAAGIQLNRLGLRFKKLAASSATVNLAVKQTGLALTKFAAKAGLAGTGLKKLGANLLKSSGKMAAFGAMAKTVGTAISAFGAKIKAASAAIAGLGTSMVMAGAMMMAALAPIIIVGAKFQQSMQDARAVIGDVEEAAASGAKNFTLLTAKAKELGSTTEHSASQAAEAMKFMGMAGLESKDIMDGVESVMQLATAGTMELGRAADIATDIMQAFKLEGEDLTRVVDVLAQTANNSNTDISMLGESFKYVASIASNLGQGLEQTSAMLGVLANNGIKASTAGTGLRMIFAKLATQTDKADAVLAQYGLTFDDVDSSQHRLIDTMKLLKAKGMGVGDVFAMFGARAGGAFLALYGDIQKVDDMMGLVADNFMAAATMQQKKLNSLTGSWKMLKSAMEGLSLSIFQSYADELRNTVDWMTMVIRKMEDWVKNNQKLTGTLVGVAAKLSMVLIAVGAVALGISVLGKVFAPLMMAAGPVLKGIVFLLSSIATVAGSIKAAIVAVFATAFVAAVIMAKDEFVRWADILKSWYDWIVGGFTSGFRAAFNNAFVKTISEAIEKGKAAFKSISHSLETMTQSLMNGENWFKKVGRVMGEMAAIGLEKIFQGVAWAIEKTAAGIQWLVDEWVVMARYLHIIAADSETSTERMSRLKEEAYLAAGKFKKLNSTFKEFKLQIGQTGAKWEKYLDLMKRYDKLTALELKQFAKLKKEIGGKNNQLRKTIDTTKEAIKTLKQQLHYGNLTDAARRKAQQSLTIAENALDRLNKLEAERTTQMDENRAVYGMSIKQTEEAAEAAAKEEKALKALKDAATAYSGDLEKLIELEKEYDEDTSDLNKYDAKIKKLEDLHEVRMQEIQDMKERFKLLMKEDAKDGVTEEEKKKWEEKTKQLDDLEKKEEDRHQRNLQREQDQRKADQATFENEMKLDKLRASGDSVAIAEEEATQKFETAKARAAELYDLESVNEKALYDQAIKHAEAVRDAEIKAAKDAAAEKENKEMERFNKERKKNIHEIRKGERDVFNELGKQVKNLGQLVALERVRLAIQDNRVARARKAHNDAIKDSNRLQTLQDKLAVEDDADKRKVLQHRIKQLEGDVAFEQGLAQQRAGEAGMQVDGAAMAKAEEAKEKLKQILGEVDNLKGLIEVSLKQIETLFGTYGKQFAEAIYSGAEGSIGGFEAQFPITRDQVNQVLNGWNPQLQTWADSVEAIFSNLAGRCVKHLARIQLAVADAQASMANLPSGPGGGSGGSGGSGGTQTNFINGGVPPAGNTARG